LIYIYSLHTSTNYTLEENPIIDNYHSQSHPHSYSKVGERVKLTFKNPNFSSKFRIKERNARVAKNVKNMVQDTLDSISYNQCK
jgi:hypothetical protein